MDSPALDPLDHAILGKLRQDARISWRELGDSVGLGPTATADRVRRLVDVGVIKRFTTVVEPGALGIGLQALIDLRIASEVDPDDFEAELRGRSEVQAAFHLTGPFDYQLLVSCADVASLDGLLRGWKREGMVAESSTRLMLAEVDLG